MTLTVYISYKKLNEKYLIAIENDSIDEFRLELKEFVKKYNRHVLGYRFLAKVEDRLGNHKEALMAYGKVIEFFNPKKAGLIGPRILEDIKLYAMKHGDERLIQSIDFKLDFYKQGYKFGERKSSIHNRNTFSTLLSESKWSSLRKESQKNTQEGVMEHATEKFDQGNLEDALIIMKDGENRIVNPSPSIEFYTVTEN